MRKQIVVGILREFRTLEKFSTMVFIGCIAIQGQKFLEDKFSHGNDFPFQFKIPAMNAL